MQHCGVMATVGAESLPKAACLAFGFRHILLWSQRLRLEFVPLVMRLEFVDPQWQWASINQGE